MSLAFFLFFYICYQLVEEYLIAYYNYRTEQRQIICSE